MTDRQTDRRQTDDRQTDKSNPSVPSGVREKQGKGEGEGKVEGDRGRE